MHQSHYPSLILFEAEKSLAKDYKLSASWEATQVLNFSLIFDFCVISVILVDLRLFFSFCRKESSF